MNHSSIAHFVEFNGNTIETTVTHKASVADNWVQNIVSKYFNGKNIVFGFDCKYRPHPIESMTNKVALIQICNATHCLILQLYYMDINIPESIRNLLSDSKITFIGVRSQENAMKLKNEYGLNLSRYIDVRLLAKTWFPVSYKGCPSLKALAHRVAGLEMRRNYSERSSWDFEWELSVLDDELIECACVDAYACFRIAHKLLKEMKDLDDSH